MNAFLSQCQSLCERGLPLDAGPFFIVYAAINKCWSLSFHTQAVCRVKYLKFTQFAVYCVFMWVFHSEYMDLWNSKTHTILNWNLGLEILPTHFFIGWETQHTHRELETKLCLFTYVNYSKPKQFATGVNALSWQQFSGNTTRVWPTTPYWIDFIPTAVVFKWEECIFNKNHLVFSNQTVCRFLMQIDITGVMGFMFVFLK